MPSGESSLPLVLCSPRAATLSERARERPQSWREARMALCIVQGTETDLERCLPEAKPPPEQVLRLDTATTFV